MKRATTVMNVITEDRDTYFNDISLKENLITSIILETNGYSKMTFDKELREKV